MSVGSRFSNSSARLISRFGRTVTYTRVSEGEYNIETGEVEDSTSSSQCIKAYKTDNSNEDVNSPDLVGKQIVTYLISSELGFVPETDDIISFSFQNKDYKEVVRRVKENWAGDCVAHYRIVCISE